ncbi:MAG: c-type cytochrome [Anaerolineae bacterium]
MGDRRLLARLMTLAAFVTVAAILAVALSGAPPYALVSAQTGATPSDTGTPPDDQALAARGEALVRTYGCLVCHTTNGTALIGPTFRGLYGSTVQLLGGTTTVADAAYLRGAIIYAHREVVEGFPLIMPDYSGTIDAEQLDAIVAYLGTLSAATAATPMMTAAAMTPMMTITSVAMTPMMTVPTAAATAEGTTEAGLTGVALEERGAALLRSYGCLACHTTTGAALLGPTFRGLFRSSVPLQDGGAVQADEEYLRRSILAAHLQTVEGFPPGLMPDYSGIISDTDVTAMVAYIKTLSPVVATTVTPGATAAATGTATAVTTPVATAMVTAMPQDDAALTATGAELVETYGCLNCHTTDGQAYLGPTFLGLYGSMVRLTDGSTVLADEAFLRRSILAAHAQVAEGFDRGMMPNYTGIIGTGQMNAIIAYLRSLGTGQAAATATAVPTAVAATPMATAATPTVISEAAQQGATLVQDYGCLSCHTTTGARLIGPTFRGLYGSTVTLVGGGTIVADEAYLVRSIVSAHVQTVQGFEPGVMPDYIGVISEEEAAAIVEYIKTLPPAAAATGTQVPMATGTAMAGGDEALNRGVQLATDQGCRRCHSIDGTRLIGPSWLGLAGREETLTDGTTVMVNAAYLTESILEANAKIVQGYSANIMPAYAGRLDGAQVDDLVAYIESLGAATSAQEVVVVVAQTTVVPTEAATGTPVAVDAAAAARGMQLATDQGCPRCHSVDGTRLIGPSFLGLYGREQTFTDGSTAMVDAAYLTESIVDPSARIVRGFSNNMASYTGRIDDAQVSDLVAYIETLGAGAAVTPVAQRAATPTIDPTQRAALQLVPTVAADQASLAAGRELLIWLDCLTCHTTTGRTAVGPTFRGLYNSSVRLSDGTIAVADDQYIRTQILRSHAQTVADYPTWVMPDYSRAINEQQMELIIAYIRSLR